MVHHTLSGLLTFVHLLGSTKPEKLEIIVTNSGLADVAVESRPGGFWIDKSQIKQLRVPQDGGSKKKSTPLLNDNNLYLFQRTTPRLIQSPLKVPYTIYPLNDLRAWQ